MEVIRIRYFNFNNSKNSKNEIRGLSKNGLTYHTYRDVDIFFDDKKVRVESIGFEERLNVLTIFGYNSFEPDCISTGSRIANSTMSIILSPEDAALNDILANMHKKIESIYIKIGEDEHSSIITLSDNAFSSVSTQIVAGAQDVLRYVFSFVTGKVIFPNTTNETNVKNSVEESSDYIEDSVEQKIMLQKQKIVTNQLDSHIYMEMSSFADFEVIDVEMFIEDSYSIKATDSNWKKVMNNLYEVTSSNISITKNYVKGYLNVTYIDSSNKKVNASINFNAI